MKVSQVTEQRVDELAPVVAAAVWILRWVAVRGAWPVLKWIVKKHSGKLLVGASATAALDQGWDWVISQLGAEMAQMLIENKFTIAMAVAFILGAAVFKRFFEKQGEKLVSSNESVFEIYKQKAGDYARHGGPMPKKKKRGPHPLGGKLVG
jgi:hypothetical protein